MTEFELGGQQLRCDWTYQPPTPNIPPAYSHGGIPGDPAEFSVGKIELMVEADRWLDITDLISEVGGLEVIDEHVYEQLEREGTFELGEPEMDDETDDEEGAAQYEEIYLETVEPPVPPGLRTLPEELEALARFLHLDEDLIAAAAQGSADLDVAGTSREAPNYAG